MKIKLSEIKASPKPIRSSWDEEKMEELAQSIREQGLIVPIKVRPLNGKYEIVYGHRRVEAARRAGLDEIEAIVEGMGDTDTLIQALIENIQREDMEPIDKANAMFDLKEKTGWSNSEIERRGIMDRTSVSQLIALLVLPKDIQDLIGSDSEHLGPNQREKPLTPRHILDSSPAVDDQQDVLRKAAREWLTARQTRKVAESIAATQDPRRRDALLNTPYSSFIHDPEINRERAERYGAYDPLMNSNEPSAGAVFQMTMEVKMIIDYLKSSRKSMTEEVRKMYEVGKFSPEAVPFVIREARLMIDAWQKLIDELETK